MNTTKIYGGISMQHYNNQSEYIKAYKNEKKQIKLVQLILIIAILLLWEFLTRLNIIDSFIFSSPTNIIKTIITLAKGHNLFIHIFYTLKEITISMSLGLIIGFIISILFFLYPKIEKIFEPFLIVLNSMPKVALAPIIIILFGAKEKSIIIIAILINVVVNILNITTSFKNTDTSRIKLFKTLNASKKDTLIKLVIPSSYASIIANLKITISLTLIGVITGEFLVSKAGIGYLIINGSQIFNLDLVASGICILVILSYILYKLVIILEKKLLK